ncbi:MAG: hypothetical protein H0U86_11615 [Chloroflexi bacterium]|nr:hypothetical protein [Chloroflexota bacterium]
MAAAAELLTTGRSEVVSPELVLVDPRLAMEARAALQNPHDTFARLEQRLPVGQATPQAVVPSADRASTTDEEIGAARRRISELSEVEPPTQRRARLVTLVSVAAAWCAVALLIADLKLGLYKWPF